MAFVLNRCIIYNKIKIRPHLSNSDGNSLLIRSSASEV